MSINLESGLWRCFKTGNTGNFVKLYSQVEGIPFRRAYEKFLFDSFIAEPKQEEPKPEVKAELEIGTLEELHPFKDYSDYVMALASELVHARCMEGEKFYVCKDGLYKDRLIIPFLNADNKMFYFQARGLTPMAYPKYLNCKNLKMSQVLYPFNYDLFDPLYITEGVFDCLALRRMGFNATTTLSCHVSKEQMSQLKFYRGPLVVAYDSDAAGQKGVSQFMLEAFKAKRSDLFRAVPSGVKDWNELLVSDGPQYASYTAGKLSPLNPLELAVSSI